MCEMKKVWLPEYRDVPAKRCMQVDVVVAADGSRDYPDTVRNRIHAAALENLGQTVSLKDIAELIGRSYAYVNMCLAGKREFKDSEMDAVEGLLGCRIFSRNGIKGGK